MMGCESNLFSGEALDVSIRQKYQELDRIIAEINNDDVMNKDLDVITDDVIQRLRVDVPVLSDDIHRVAQGEARTGESYVTFSVPFVGNAVVFQYKPHLRYRSPAKANIFVGHVEITCVRNDHNSNALLDDFKDRRHNIQNILDIIRQDVAHFNETLQATILHKLKQRKAKLIRDQEMFDAIPYPLVTRKDTPVKFPITPKRIVTKHKPDPNANGNQEHFLDMPDYERILQIVNSMSKVLERCPEAFVGMSEEHIRHHFLIPLNAIYEGQATGETFNMVGKTDILIRVADNNVFIAECKFWKGGQVLKSTIDQLLGYTMWRDTKTALIIFSENADFTKVLEQISDVVKSHSNCLRDLGSSSQTEFRYEFCHNGDRNQKLILTVMAFNIPTDNKGSVQ